jgi:hypothetical protein
MPEELSNESPTVAADPDAELARLIERSIQLQMEGLAVNKRIRELHEQVAQRHQAKSADEAVDRTKGDWKPPH